MIDDLMLGSLCTGYGGLDLAVDSVLGTRTAWVSDIDPGACRILAHRYPDVPNLGDLTDVDWTEVEPIDVLTAGYPCQPFSHAGQRKGTSDDRHIWPNIADAIGVLRPRLVVLENVAGHLSLGGPAVIGDLARLGYDARWLVIRASDVGACHRRARLFIAARDTSRYSGGVLDGERVRASSNSGSAGRPEAARRAPSSESEGRRPRTNRDHVSNGDGTAGSDRGDMVQQAPSDSEHDGPDRREAGSTGRVRAIEGRRTSAPDPERVGWSPRPGLRPSESERVGRGRPRNAGREGRWGPYAPAIARHEEVLGREAPPPSDGKGRLAPRFVEWMMMVPDGWVTDVPGLPRTAQLKALGNGVVPLQGACAIDLMGVR